MLAFYSCYACRTAIVAMDTVICPHGDCVSVMPALTSLSWVNVILVTSRPA